MAAEIKKKYGEDTELVRGGSGVFEVSLDGKPLFSKKKLHRFPEVSEIFELADGAR